MLHREQSNQLARCLLMNEMIQLKNDIACEWPTIRCDINPVRHFRHEKNCYRSLWFTLCQRDETLILLFKQARNETHIEVICTGVKVKLASSYRLTIVLYFSRLKYCPQLENPSMVVTTSDRGPQTHHPSNRIHVFPRYHSIPILFQRILKYHVQIKCHLNVFCGPSQAS